MFKNVLKPTIILVLICVLTTLALAGTQIVTKDAIARQEKITSEKAQKEVLPGFETISEESTDIDGKEVKYYIAYDSSSNIMGYVFATEYKGYSGAVKIMTGINKEGTVTGVVIISDNETPGLGKKAHNEEFKGQFANKKVDKFSVVKIASDKDDEITAITGATITSDAVTISVNEALSIFAKIAGGGK